MRILLIATLFKPFFEGGAEISAHYFATWLVENGHEVSVLATAPTPADETWGTVEDGYRIYRVSIPRAYTPLEASRAPVWKKPIWHAQDLLDPRNEAVVGRVLDAVKPDVVNIHILQGIGYNALKALGKRNLPVVYTLHDLGLACVKMAMFIDGKECAGQCTTCALSSKVKTGYLRSIERLAFISPSTANFDKLRQFQPIDDYPCHRVLNANRYPLPEQPRVESDVPRLLYVGRLHVSKGVEVVLEALDSLSERYRFTMDILGAGPDEARWRETYGDRPWLRFHGHVTLEQVAEVMNQSDLLLVPSIWHENSPGVVIQALGLGLPVMGSNKGGIPELVSDGVNGLLVAPGDVAAWRDAIAGVLDAPERLTPLRAEAAAATFEFDRDYLGRKALAVLESVAR
ncbi:hypothetical protein COC42_16610 [Sphingomonas spermidinifaciens]|uniref:Glycosyltransferase subfamily 4-like N-terminal domain-containing protein n=1 Tax=Sphingomonas spermidinifaciens TaxID=1141889 RepID=A0A2A4AXR2_9SPHN|nr:glycosyltransferase family 4 protein [Sphingomonas spermidinifaciens]PCD01733.1 hypothetical protein COC42_16610 [Sphingomonas spermidinifaciens]